MGFESPSVPYFFIFHSVYPVRDTVRVTADLKAKETSHMLLSGNIAVPDIITFSNACKISADIAVKSWQHKWNESNTGRYTYEFIHNVGVKILFPVKRDTGITYCRMLLHGTMLKDDSYKTGTSSSPICDCGVEKETIDHFLLRCSNYTKARKAMFDRIEALCLFSHNKFHSQVNEHLLLAPSDGSIITKKDDYYIKEALFEFLATVDQSL